MYHILFEWPLFASVVETASHLGQLLVDLGTFTIITYEFLMKNIKKGPKRPLIRRTLPLDHQFDMLALKFTCYSK